MKKTIWQSPSNIALVKYWGKHGFQLPNNPSVSFTLSNSTSITEIEQVEKNSNKIQFFFEGKNNEDFARRIKKYFDKISEIFPFLNDYSFIIKSSNNFPHSAGIASSASAFSALALCIVDLAKQNGIETSNFYQTASNIARMGSGSACRSIYGGVNLWGKHNEIAGSSDEFAIKLNDVNDIFYTYNDDIVIIDSGKKPVSSSLGHNLMDTNPFKEQKYKRAFQNTRQLYNAMQTADLDKFIDITEEEALSLHAMMSLSKPSFILMKPESLQVINIIRRYRKEKNVPVCFTLDAGPNVHILYPDAYRNSVQEMLNDLQEEIADISIINDKVGNGSKKLPASNR